MNMIRELDAGLAGLAGLRTFITEEAFETGPVCGDGRVPSMGRSVAYAQARLVDEAGPLHGSATGTLLATGR